MIELCRASLGWHEDDPSEAFFAWKHDHNPFGPSPAWVAEDADGSLAGVRVFMRWRFAGADGVRRAVRAVDTATRPDMQGRGIFTRLTTAALPDLADEGCDLVFNTPNDQSRPGYLKMGWQVVGRVPVAMRPRSLGSLRRMPGARSAARKWSEPTEVGLDAAAALADQDEVARLLAVCAAPSGLGTERTPAYLHWRYSFDALHYRVVPLGDRLADGLVVFRLRRRGTALEAAICEGLAPRPGAERRAVGWVLRRTGADYALRCDDGAAWRAAFLPVPRMGPILTWRPLRDGAVPDLGDLSLALGDVELF
jgi:GNAT superfamily N-acetyltransferase